jgi:hypothetical protein
VAISNSTVSGNSATGNGDGIYNGHGGGSATLELSNTVLNAGNSGKNIFNTMGGTVTSLGYNLSSDNGGGYLTSPGDQINTDPMLGPLQDNGGPTFTHALLPGSPAINAGDPSGSRPPFSDQRGPGFARVVNGRLDIGSFEVQNPTPTPTPGAPGASTNPATKIASFSATLNGTVNPNGFTTSVHFQYGTTTSYGSTTSNQSYSGNTTRAISANISGLAANTTYHFRIVAANSHGTRYGGDRTFTTLGPTGPPVVVTNPATLIASFSATLNGSVDPHGLTTTVYFQYGTTTSYGLTTAIQSKSGNTY